LSMASRELTKRKSVRSEEWEVWPMTRSSG
jgi:hypothetical protein